MPHGHRPRHGQGRRHRRRHRRQQPRPPPRPARLARHRPDRQGPAAQPGRLDRPRVELHLPGRPLPRDHRPDARLGAAVPGDGRLHRVRRLRGRPHRGADGGAAPPDVVSAKAWGIEAELVTPGSSCRRRCRSSTPTRSSAPSGRPAVGVVDSLRAGTIMRERAHGSRRAHRRTRTSRSPASTSSDGRDHAGSAPTGGDIEAEHVVIACGVWSPKIGDDGRGVDPADPRRAPDDQRRPVPAARRDARARSRSRSSATWTRSATSASTAPTWRSAPTRTARSCMEPEDIPSIEQAKLSPDRAAVHRRRLRPAARAGLRADARAARRRGRRDPLRHQRPALADLRRRARSSARARGQGPLDRRPRCGSRRARASAARSPSG